MLGDQLCAGWVKTDVRPWHTEDIRAQYFEQELGKAAQTPLDLFNKVPYVVPEVDSVISKEPQDGVAAHYNKPNPDQLMVDAVAYAQLPYFSWWEIFSIINVPAPKGVLKIASSNLM